MTRLSQWSQRKRGMEPAEESTAGDHATPLGEAGTAAPGGESVPATPSQATPPEETAAELPDPDTLPPDSDLTAYLVSGVSREFRRRALKRLFAADHYHHRDGLNDYDDDYRQLKNLTQEVADRLRQWTRRQDDEAEAQPLAADQTDSTPPDSSRHATQDPARSDDAPASQSTAERASDDPADPTQQQEAEHSRPPRNSGELSKR